MTRAPAGASTFPDLLDRAAETFGDEEAVFDPASGRRVTFTELRDLVRTAGARVIAAGVEPGDRVAIWAPNSLDWMIAALGSVCVGAALVPLNTRLKADEASFILGRSGAKLAFVSGPFLGTDYPALVDSLRGSLPGLETVVVLGSTPDRLACTDHLDARWGAVGSDTVGDIIFTSGTTGRPKGVVTTQSQTIKVFETWSRVVGLERGDRYLVINPFFHTFGYKAGIVASLIRGATVIPMASFDVEAALDLMTAERVSVLPGPPTIYQSILDFPGRELRDLSSLRLAVTGAAVVPVVLIERMRDELKIATVLTAYGLTESTGTVSMCERDDDAVTIATTCGRAIPDTEVRIVAEDGSVLPSGEAGEVVVRGYNVMQGYFDDPEATAETIDEDGWLHTGDIGVLDERGYLRITDRLKDMYVVGGFNAYPAEIEQALARHPAIAESAVIGVPDERMGEVGKAFVVLRPGQQAEPEEILAWSREQMANYKVPRNVVIVDVLPRNASGKVLKTELRNHA